MDEITKYISRIKSYHPSINLSNGDVDISCGRLKILFRYVKKKNPKIFFLPSFMQPLSRLAIAAAFIIVVGGSFIFLNNSVSKKTEASIVANNISLHELSNEEIESYVDANEWIAEIDVQAQMQKENAKLSSLDAKQIQEIEKIINK